MRPSPGRPHVGLPTGRTHHDGYGDARAVLWTGGRDCLTRAVAEAYHRRAVALSTHLTVDPTSGADLSRVANAQ